MPTPPSTGEVYAHALPEDDATAAEIWNMARKRILADKNADETGALANVNFKDPEKRLTLVTSGS
jgi:hypothetical protein